MKRWTILAVISMILGNGPAYGQSQDTLVSNPDSSEVKQIRKALWQSNITVPEASESTETLSRAIDRIREVRLPDPKKKAELALVPESQPAAAEKMAEDQHSGKLTPETLLKLKLALPGGATDPELLADALFYSGHAESAEFFYRHALEKAQEEDRKAWLLFQIANCQKQFDPVVAGKTYGEFLEQYPASPWVSLALAQKHLIEWRTLNNVDLILKRIELN